MQEDGNGREDDDACQSSSLVIMSSSSLSATDQQLTQEWHVDERLLQFALVEANNDPSAQ